MLYANLVELPQTEPWMVPVSLTTPLLRYHGVCASTGWCFEDTRFGFGKVMYDPVVEVCLRVLGVLLVFGVSGDLSAPVYTRNVRL